MFPLGTVLVPTAVLPLHLFEPRYRTLMDDLTGVEEPEFGIVLIERGSEVGGGDLRVPVGTVARLLDAQKVPDGRWVIAVLGTRRFRVDRWLPDDPYPVAEVSGLAEVTAWATADDPLLVDAARRVRRALGLAAELGESGIPMTFDLDDDPLVASWQLCALAPVGPLDRQSLLETGDPAARLRGVVSLTEQVSNVLEYRLGNGQ